MTSRVERLTGVSGAEQLPALLVGLGHGGTHWIIGTFYLLLPFVKTDLGLSFSEAGLLVTLFHLSAFLANFGSGTLVDVTGQRVAVQCASLMLGAAALLACGWASGAGMLAVLVMVMGATNNMWHPAAISFLSERYPHARGYALSVHTLGASLGDSVAPAVIGAVLLWVSWEKAAQLGSLPVFLLGVVIVLGLTRHEGGTRGGESRAARMARTDYLNGLRTLIADRAVQRLSLMAGFRSMAQSGLLVFVPLYLANELAVGPLLTGLGVMAMQLGGLVAGPIAGILSDRIGRRRVVLAGLSGTTVTIVVLTLTGNELLFIAGISVLGFMLFAVRPVIHGWMMDITPPALAGSATSVLFGAQSALSMAAPILGGLIADRWGMSAVFYALAAIMLVANLLVGSDQPNRLKDKD